LEKLSVGRHAKPTPLQFSMHEVLGVIAIQKILFERHDERGSDASSTRQFRDTLRRQACRLSHLYKAGH
jgi:hypothetical protein